MNKVRRRKIVILSRPTVYTVLFVLPFIVLTINLIAERVYANPVIPTQYISKVYSEGLGRVADQSGWQNYVNFFNAYGCSANTLKTAGKKILTSTKFKNLNYDNFAKTLVAYRTIFNREPSSSEFNNVVNQLNSGLAWTALLNSLYESAEFNNLSALICNNSNPNYGFSTQPVLDIPTTGSGFTGTQLKLQNLLNSTVSGGTVALKSRTVIRLASPLVIPEGVTLTTNGNPSPTHYANMARLVRSGTFDDALVKLKPGAKLQNVWVDGQRDQSTNSSSLRFNVLMQGGKNTTVSNNRLSNTAGASNVVANGSNEGVRCSQNVISGNLIDDYTSSHLDGNWADGISVHCEDTAVYSNSVIDASDVGNIIFSLTSTPQSSKVYNNTILSAGNSVYAALGADPFFNKSGGDRPNVATRPFSGAVVYNNTLWTGPRTHFDIGMTLGTRAWFGKQSYNGNGVSFKHNTTGSQQVRTGLAISVSGMLNATVQGNTLKIILIPTSNCPHYNIAASISAGYASGSLQPSPADVLIAGCIVPGQ